MINDILNDIDFSILQSKIGVIEADESLDIKNHYITEHAVGDTIYVYDTDIDTVIQEAAVGETGGSRRKLTEKEGSMWRHWRLAFVTGKTDEIKRNEYIASRLINIYQASQLAKDEKYESSSPAHPLTLSRGNFDSIVNNGSYQQLYNHKTSELLALVEYLKGHKDDCFIKHFEVGPANDKVDHGAFKFRFILPETLVTSDMAVDLFDYKKFKRNAKSTELDPKVAEEYKNKADEIEKRYHFTTLESIGKSIGAVIPGKYQSDEVAWHVPIKPKFKNKYEQLKNTSSVAFGGINNYSPIKKIIKQFGLK